MGLILLACFLWRNEPPGFCQSIVILDHLRPRKLYAGAVRLAVANASSVSPDITHKIAGECVVTTADTVFIFQKLQLFLCGVRRLVKSINSGAATRSNAAAQKMLVDFIFGDEAFLRWQLCQLADVFSPGKGVFFQWANQSVGVVYLKPHHALVSVAGIPEGIDLVHDCLVGLRVRQQIYELFRFFRETTPERANDAHIPRFHSFLAYITGHIPKLFCKLPLFKSSALGQFHIGGEPSLFQQFSNSDGNILPRDNLGISGIPGGVAIGQAHTVLGIPSAYFLTIELQAIAAMVCLF